MTAGGACARCTPLGTLANNIITVLEGGDVTSGPAVHHHFELALLAPLPATVAFLWQCRWRDPYHGETLMHMHIRVLIPGIRLYSSTIILLKRQPGWVLLAILEYSERRVSQLKELSASVKFSLSLAHVTPAALH